MSVHSKLLLCITGLLLAGLIVAALIRWSPAPEVASPTSNPQLATQPDALQVAIDSDSAAPTTNPIGNATMGDRHTATTATLTVRGRLRHQGVPLPDCALTLQWLRGTEIGSRDVDAEYELVSDARGEFEWRGPLRTSPAMVGVERRAAKAQLFCLPVIVLPEQSSAFLEIDAIPLHCTLRGIVRNMSGAGISGAQVNVNGWRETTTDADGRFTLSVPRGGNSRPLDVHARGYAQQLVDLAVPADAVEHEVEIQLAPGQRYAGKVVDASGVAIAGATVRASGLFHSVSTDAAGRFELDSAKPGSNHEVSAHKRGFQRAAVHAIAGRDDISLVLTPGLRLDLAVLDPAGHGVPGALIRVIDRPGGGWDPRGFTGTDGRLQLRDLAPGELVVIVDKSGFVRAQQAIDFDAGHNGLEIRLEPARTLRGQIIDTAGLPIDGASLWGELARDGGSRQIGKRTESAADGRFEFADAPQGAFRLRANHRDYASAAVEIAANVDPEIVVRMTRAPAIAGRVVDGPSGKPIPRFTVQAFESNGQPIMHGPRSFTDAGGRWRAREGRMQEGAELQIEVTATGYAPSSVKAVATANPLDDHCVIALFPGVRVFGQVRSSTSGQPIAGVQIQLAAGEARRRQESLFRSNDTPTHTDADGHFSIDSVPSGKHRLVLRHDQYSATEFGPFDVARGPGELGLHPVMSLGVELRGRVLGLADPTDWTVSVHRVDETRNTETEVAPDASFAFTGLSPGKYLISLRDPAEHSRSRWVEVGERGINDLELALHEGTGAIRGEVPGLARGYVQVSPISAKPQIQQSTQHMQEFEGGRFAVTGLAAGRYRVTVFHRSESISGKQELDVGTGEHSIVIQVGAPREGR